MKNHSYRDPWSPERTYSVILIVLILAALFGLSIKFDAILASSVSQQLKNGGFERVTTSVYQPEYWSINNYGYRVLRGDITGDGYVGVDDIVTVAESFGATPDDPKWNTETNPEGPDLNGDGYVGIDDIVMVSGEFGKQMGYDAYCADGSYSWYSDGGGDYLMWQQLNSDVAMALAGETAKFEFRFYPTSVAPNGSQNNARAEISYLLTNLESNTVFGAWVTPTSLGWWNACVITQLPSNVIALTVIIHGKPDFKAWLDSAKFNTYFYNLLYTTPPYSNQGSDPANGTRVEWMNAAIAALGNNNTGLVLVYAWDASGVGVGKTAYVQFNNDPPTGNSPCPYETGAFSIGAYWYVYGYLGQGMSALRLKIYLYYSKIGVGWVKVGEYTAGFDSIQYPNQEVYYWGSVSFSISSPPSGTGVYAITARAYAYAAGGDGAGSAVADAMYGDYAMYIDLLKISS